MGGFFFTSSQCVFPYSCQLTTRYTVHDVSYVHMCVCVCVCVCYGGKKTGKEGKERGKKRKGSVVSSFLGGKRKGRDRSRSSSHDLNSQIN